MAAAVPKREATGMAAFFPLSLTQGQGLCLEAVKRKYGINPKAEEQTESKDGDEDLKPPTPSIILDIACINSPKVIVLSGDKGALEEAMRIASSGEMGEKIKSVLLDVSAPFHSRYMTPAEVGLRKYISGLNIKLTTAPVISGLSNEPMRIFDQFANNFIPLTSSTVNFMGCIEQANNLLCTQSQPVENPLWIEIGPKPTLSSFVTQTRGPQTETVSLCTAKDIRDFLNNPKLVDRLFPKK
jgi:acyl transferase domain-containing protein